jgi:hypothetical protein
MVTPGPSAAPAAPLELTAGVWPLLGRTILVAIGQFLVIPSPWTNTGYYRWSVTQIRLPNGNGRDVTFTGQPGDIWYIFILNALCSYAGVVHIGVQILAVPLTVLFYLIIMRWFFANLMSAGRSTPLQFTGTYWGLLGWSVLTWLAMFTIIGWAWATTATIRWVCRHVEGSRRQLGFAASGWSMLWRTFVLSFACIFIIPIPWMLRWYSAWIVSEFYLEERAPVPAT